MDKNRSWGMFVRHKHTGEILGWVGTAGNNSSYPANNIRSVLDGKCVMGIKDYNKALLSFGVFKAICHKNEPGVFTPFLVRLSKNKHSNSLKCKHIADIVKPNGKSILVKYEFSYETV